LPGGGEVVRFEEMMSQCYKLTCRCGAEHPIETSQAGRVIECSCGRQLDIPSMLKIKRLPLWESSDTSTISDSAVSEPVAPGAEKVGATLVVTSESVSDLREKKKNKRAASGRRPKTGKFPAARKGLVIAGTFGFILFSALFAYKIWNPPKLIDVLNIQRYYLDKGRLIQRDSSPIEEEDAYFFITKDNYIVNDTVIDLMLPAYAVDYFDYLKTGLDFSDNFYDKYDSLVVSHRILTTFFGLLAGGSLVVALVPLFLPNEQKSVGVARGSDWKS
jgi:hypothetical protein